MAETLTHGIKISTVYILVQVMNYALIYNSDMIYSLQYLFQRAIVFLNALLVCISSLRL